MAKEIKNGAEARKALEAGVNQLADTVKVTLGAGQEKTVDVSGTVKVTNDLVVKVDKTEFKPFVKMYSALGWVKLDGSKMKQGDKITIEYDASDAGTSLQYGYFYGDDASKVVLGSQIPTWGDSKFKGLEKGPAEYGKTGGSFETKSLEVDVSEKANLFFSIQVNHETEFVGSIKITSAKVMRDGKEVEGAVTEISDKYTFEGVNNYPKIAEIALKDYYDASKYDKVSVKYTVAGDEKLGSQVKVVGSIDCKTPISNQTWDKMVAAISYSGDNETEVTKELSFAGLADADNSPSVVIAMNRDDKAAKFNGTVTIKEIKLIAKK